MSARSPRSSRILRSPRISVIPTGGRGAAIIAAGFIGYAEDALSRVGREVEKPTRPETRSARSDESPRRTRTPSRADGLGKTGFAVAHPSSLRGLGLASLDDSPSDNQREDPVHELVEDG